MSPPQPTHQSTTEFTSGFENRNAQYDSSSAMTRDRRRRRLVTAAGNAIARVHLRKTTTISFYSGTFTQVTQVATEAALRGQAAVTVAPARPAAPAEGFSLV